MSTSKDNLREDFSKRPEDLEREANDVREDMEKTIDQLMNQLSPGELINHALDRFKNGGDSAFTRNLVSQVQNNPVPAVLTGCGLAWLMASSKQPPASAGHTGVGVGEAKEQAGHLKEQMSETLHQSTENARQGVHAAQQSYNDLLREQPLFMGALAVAAGAAIGAMLPASSVEDEMVGPTSEKTTEELERKAQQKMEEGQEQGAAASSPERSSQEHPAQESQQASTSDQSQQVQTGQSARSEEHRSQSPVPPSGRSPV
ncbi:DUF3618 domain-containing protein [Marinimicrobium sp. ABcell2]|uniref:DUF3618 domain-containing protein n=1 Tax=Marinimicrobium sp. ABcell2 TaxID=3069751 RepID=UPI0027B5D4EA|nr:DUF3618 domain-containing protein [Marinimicrobium sp. ABcell2]MDQ2077666.1 DUF3618 domain-containing protein [Marinimicrobium sp. ABcell2]